MSSDAILDLTAAAVVFGSVLVVAYWETIWGKLRRVVAGDKKHPPSVSGTVTNWWTM